MDDSPTPIWQPITQLPFIASIIDGQLEEAEVQLQNLSPRASKAPILEDALVERLIRLFTEQEALLPVYEEQLFRWKREPLSDDQYQEIERLERCLDRDFVVLSDILALAREYGEMTMEEMLAKDDAEVGLDFLLDKMNRWT